MITRNCKYCGKEFKTYKAWLRNGKGGFFCSVSCQIKGRKKNPSHLIEKVCVVCGKRYFVRRYRDNSSTCCSYECVHKRIGLLHNKETHPNWKGGISEIKHVSKKLRRIVLERDKKCVLCGETERLEVHHIEDVSKNIDRKEDVDNCQVLCYKCHALQHKNIYNFIIARYEVLKF